MSLRLTGIHSRLPRIARLAALVAALAAPPAARAQDNVPEPLASETVTIAPKPATLSPRLRFQHLDRSQGLPQNTVAAIAQDRTGFIWMGTEDGLVRYDGQRFAIWRHDQAKPDSLANSLVTDILVGKDGALWVGTGGGLDRYRPESSGFQHIQAAQPETLRQRISSLSEGPDGRIWIATLGGGLSVLDPATSKVRTFSIEDGLPPAVSVVVAGADNAVWVGTAQGMYRLDGARGGIEPLFADREALKTAAITALRLDRAGSLWIGTDGEGLVRYTPASRQVQVHRAEAGDPARLADDSIKAVYEDRQGQVWVGTEQALHVLDPASGRFERHVHDIGDPMSLTGSVQEILQDAAGVLWVGTFGRGAAMLDPRSRQFLYYRTPAVTQVVVNGKDLWTTTFEGVCRWRGAGTYRGVCYTFGFVTNVVIDRHGAVWIGTMTNGLFRLDKGATDRWIHFENDPSNPDSLAPGPVLGMHEDKSGELWFGFLEGGPQRYDRGRDRFISVELPSSSVYGIQDDPVQKGVLWVGTADVGLLRLQLDTGTTEIYTPDPKDLLSRTDNAVVDFAFAGDDVIWLATYGGGLKRLDRKRRTFKSYLRSDGIPSDTICSLRSDPAGNLWVSTIAGLARFEPKTGKLRLFGTADGLQSAEFAQHSRATDGDGRLYFGGVDGFNVFTPDAISLDTFRAPIVLTSVRVVGDEVRGRPDALRQLEVDHDQALVDIDFAALSFSASDQFTFEYRVAGLNDRWLKSDTASVSLAGLDAGDYTLEVRGRNRHGVESAPIALAITVHPPFYLTWWAFGIYGLLILGTVVAVFRSQQVRIRRLQKLARLAAMEREYEVTAAVQSWFLPESGSYISETTELVGFYRGAEKCSGDWWWYEDLGQGKLWLLVADVTGHGAGPAMLTAAVAMGIWVQQATTSEEVLDRLVRVNRVVLGRCKGKALMTMTGVVFDQNSGEALVYGMGGLPAVVISDQGKLSVVGARGSPIGSATTLDVGHMKTHLGPRDRLIITTDGIVEARMQGDRPFGFRRFVNLLQEMKGKPLNEAAAEIVTRIDAARGQRVQDDDYTFCVLERRG